MAKEFAKVHPGFAGGVLLFSSPNITQAYNIENMILEPDGKAYKRQGCDYQTRIPPIGAQILSTFRWDREGQPDQLIAQGNDGHLYYTTDLINWTDSGAGDVLSHTNPASFAVGYSPGSGGGIGGPGVYIVDGVGPLWRWNGTTLVNMTSTRAAPSGMRFLCYWSDTMYGYVTPASVLYLSLMRSTLIPDGRTNDPVAADHGIAIFPQSKGYRLGKTERQ
jgi:hypothetical protein